MEIRGLGIINIKDIFGVGSVRDNQQVELIINIEEANPEMYYDRTGLDEEFDEILGVKTPLIRIPVKPGRNIPILVETASMNQRLKNMGSFGARDFNKRITEKMYQRKID
jgi:HPr kinase/phosphorylase